MRPSILAMANKHNPQPLQVKSIDNIVAPGHISTAKHHTVVTRPGDVGIVDIFAPGFRKLVTNSSTGTVRIVGANVDNFDLPQSSWVLFENIGDGWRGLYSGDGAVRCKKKRPEILNADE